MELHLRPKAIPGGNDTLWAINEIANTDKHRKYLVDVTLKLNHGFALSGDSGPYIDGLHIRPSNFQHILADEDREKVLLSMRQAVSQLDIEHQLSVSVVFGSGFGVDKKDILSTLNEQIRQTDYIIKNMTHLFD
jgi:hypothetical protein